MAPLIDWFVLFVPLAIAYRLADAALAQPARVKTAHEGELA